MRLRLVVVAATMLAATVLMPTPPASAATFTVDNLTAGQFTASANWGSSAFSAQRFGTNYRFATPDTTASDPAWFRMDLPTAGSYLVEIWYPADPGYNDSTPFVIATSGGNQEVRVNQRANGGRWVSLGSFSFAAGDHNVVAVSRWTSGTGYVIADAVRLTNGSTPPSIVLPLAKSALPRSEYDDPHHDYPAIDLPVGTGTAAFAVRAGTVVRIDDDSCGMGINLTGTDGAIYTYCHFSAWSVAHGATVTVGQRLGSTGSTGNSTGPHLHFGIRTGSTRRCPQQFLLALYDGTTPPAATSLPTTGCFTTGLAPAEPPLG